MSSDRTRSPFRLNSLLAIAGALIAGPAVQGCHRTAHFQVVHPAMINPTVFGNTITVGQFQGDFQAAQQISTDLRNRIANSLNRSIQLMAGGGGLVVDGAIPQHVYLENIERSSATCYHTVRYGNTYQRVAHSCTHVTRVGTARAAVEFRAISTSTGQVIFDRTYARELTRRESATEGPYAEDNTNLAPIDGGGMLSALEASHTEEFARVILPWPEMVEVGFEGCAGDARCTRGFEYAQRGNLQAAIEQFSAVIGNAAAPGASVPPDQIDRIAEALYNRGISRGYNGNYIEAVGDITTALRMRPDHQAWNEQLSRIQTLAREQTELNNQDATRTQQTNVQNAGQP